MATAATLTALMLLATACTSDAPGDSKSPGAPRVGTLSEAATDTSRTEPEPAGSGSIAAALPAGMTPTKTPAQAGKDLAGRALPTNQWWTSALTGPASQPMWTHPLGVKVGDGGLQVSSAPVAASANAVVTPFVGAITAGGRSPACASSGTAPSTSCCAATSRAAAASRRPSCRAAPSCT
jgi:endoglucanase Acf2